MPAAVSSRWLRPAIAICGSHGGMTGVEPAAAFRDIRRRVLGADTAWTWAGNMAGNSRAVKKKPASTVIAMPQRAKAPAAAPAVRAAAPAPKKVAAGGGADEWEEF